MTLCVQAERHRGNKPIMKVHIVQSTVHIMFSCQPDLRECFFGGRFCYLTRQMSTFSGLILTMLQFISSLKEQVVFPTLASKQFV